MNEFSLVCRLLGTLFNRAPDDAVVTPLLTMIEQGKLKPHWPLNQDALLERMQQNVDISALTADYHALFIEQGGAVSPWRSSYVENEAEDAVRVFLQQRGMPLKEGAVDHFGALLLAASWLEDQAAEDENAAQLALFDEFLLPWSDRFLGKVESHATTAFYRTLALLTREALDALREDLVEEEGDEDVQESPEA
ncbi:molecular chaperone [Candidatus Symbiopectobacterium sp. NZEC135]|uniref:TorD/DmsD family molecular chaperone n=1 Tax=Candidatus Symbiopectobacterium sp. NZEC135 TaxID=2820471 RepID=UPI002227C1F1|nr:molecular chaperone [Candidatus Symbiopectobacterium sp. NZEC135]MCW2479115.1 molecular chaperone [Candidatus Symbiopectobacterium sp. NZEC135]